MNTRIAYLAAALAILAGCKDRDKDQRQTYDNRQQQTESADFSNNRRVFFDFDSSMITDEAKRDLQTQSEYLKQNPDVNIIIEGNCDERGTREYNLALGARRADASKRTIVSDGIDGSRIKTISYGKDHPWKNGAGEDVWRWNRNTTTTMQ
ncbi:MAG: OmpA family protein [Rickettsiales bacterium]|jgi:peptidoglycan-associated lipoprotein|nr:OmpA family protein [Rickettsiales bacterium]